MEGGGCSLYRRGGAGLLLWVPEEVPDPRVLEGGQVLFWAQGEAVCSRGRREEAAPGAQEGAGLEVGWARSPLLTLETRG